MTFSTVFPSHHTRNGEPTYFVEKLTKTWLYLGYSISNIEGYPDFNEDVWDNNAPDAFKVHTIRAGNRWKVGDRFSPRIWSGRPYHSKMITIGPDIEVRKTWVFQVLEDGCLLLNGELYAYSSSIDTINVFAQNDGVIS